MKFRHWGGKYGMKYFTFRDITMTFDYQDGVNPKSAYVVHDYGIPQCIDCDDNGHCVMQFTGYKDLHGEEIYESDIVRSYEKLGVVAFDEQLGQWRIESKGKFLSLVSTLKTTEIIGNTYTTPNFLP